MNWLKVYRFVIITDSVVSVLKLALFVYLIIIGIQWKQAFDKTEKYDSSYVTELLIVSHFMATTLLLILILLRLMTNYNQYRIVLYVYFKVDEVFFNQCFKVCCYGFGWFILNILSIAFFIISIRIRRSTSKWINEGVSMSFLCWDVIILCIMVIFKSLMSKITYPHVVQYEKHNSPTEEISACENTKFNSDCRSNSMLAIIRDKSTDLA